MMYYITVTVSGRIRVTDQDNHTGESLAATWIAEDATDIARKLRDQGFKVTVEVKNGARDD